MDQKVKIPAPIPVGLVAPPPPAFLGRKRGGTSIVMPDGHEATCEELAKWVTAAKAKRAAERGEL